MKELGIHVKEVEKEQQNKPKEKRRGKKTTYSEVDPGLEVGRADVVEGTKYEGIEEASESLVKIIGNENQAEQERR